MEPKETNETNTTQELVKQKRWKSWPTWVAIFSALWLFLNALGLPQKWGLTESMWTYGISFVGAVAVGLGILNNPTDKDNF